MQYILYSCTLNQQFYCRGRFTCAYQVLPTFQKKKKIYIYLYIYNFFSYLTIGLTSKVKANPKSSGWECAGSIGQCSHKTRQIKVEGRSQRTTQQRAELSLCPCASIKVDVFQRSASKKLS